MRYLGTATFMLKENMHFEELQKPDQQKPPKLNVKKSILGKVRRWGMVKMKIKTLSQS